eukprot:c16141_g1_i2 orf=17-226(-)
MVLKERKEVVVQSFLANLNFWPTDKTRQYNDCTTRAIKESFRADLSQGSKSHNQAQGAWHLCNKFLERQ